MKQIESSLSKLASDPAVEAAKQRFSIIGNSPALLEAIGRAVRVAPIDLSVLVSGESGSGKEFFPKIIHQYSPRKHKKYIAVNCGAIPEGTIDSELFGHEKGSFTGAISARKGYFEEADGGTIFLDEVAELPMTTQARLLRVLETGEFLKVGSSQVQKTDIRVVAATNVNLLDAVAKGRFREDLFYRLSTVQINVPPLRDRGDDILLISRKFAADFAEKYMTARILFSDDAKRFMLLYGWPGNVRQLKNVVEQLALFEAGHEIDRHTVMSLLPPIREGDSAVTRRESVPTYAEERELLWQLIAAMKTQIEQLSARMGGTAENPNSVRSLIARGDGDDAPAAVVSDREPNEVETVIATPVTLEQSERETVIAALRRNGGNKRKTAVQLGISERTLYRKIRELNITNEDIGK